MSENCFIRILAGAVGTFGFGLVFNVEKRHLPTITVGGALCWALYEFSMSFSGSILFSSFFTAFFLGIYGEIMARIRRTPTTVYFVLTSLPLIPGSNLYYAFESLVSKNMTGFLSNLRDLFGFAFGIALGFGIVTEMDYIRMELIQRFRKQ